MKTKHDLLTALTLILVFATILILALSGLGSRWGWWNFRFGLSLLKWGFILAIPTVFVALIGVLLASIAKPAARVDVLICGASLVITAAILAKGLLSLSAAKHLPRIHDITTDTNDPPQFVAILKAREASPNSPVYGGAAVAEQQKKAYPDIHTVQLTLPTKRAFAIALKTAKEMHWDVVATTPPQRIEATATTFWFGFKDDVVIRIRPQTSGALLDIRSESRVGISDVGKNARRIRQFLRQFQANAKG